MAFYVFMAIQWKERESKERESERERKRGMSETKKDIKKAGNRDKARKKYTEMELLHKLKDALVVVVITH